MVPISILLSAVYYLSTPWRPFTGSWAVKAASVAILAAVARRAGARGLAAALVFSALGDALLDYNPDLFPVGLLAFLVAHVIYTVVFVKRWRGFRVTVGALAVLLYSAAFSAWLLPEVGTILFAVAAYVAAITAMVASAFTARFSNRLVEFGAVLFLLSDSVLAVDRFRMPVPLGAWIVWPTYFIGQLWILRGFLRVVEEPGRAR